VHNPNFGVDFESVLAVQTAWNPTVKDILHRDLQVLCVNIKHNLLEINQAEKNPGIHMEHSARQKRGGVVLPQSSPN
jgi:hypothetical protein